MLRRRTTGTGPRLRSTLRRSMKYEHSLPSPGRVRKQRNLTQLRQRLAWAAGPHVKDPFVQHLKLTQAVKNARRRTRRLLKKKPFHRRDLLEMASRERDAFLKRRLKVWYRIMKEIAPQPIREHPTPGAYGAYFNMNDYPILAAPEAPAFGEQPSAEFIAFYKRLKKVNKFLTVVIDAFDFGGSQYDLVDIFQIHDGVVMSETNNQNEPADVMFDWLRTFGANVKAWYNYAKNAMEPPPVPGDDQWEEYEEAMQTQLEQSYIPHNLHLQDVAVSDACPLVEPGTDPDANRCLLCQEPFIPGYKPVKAEIKQELGVKQELAASQPDPQKCARLKCPGKHAFHEMCIVEYLTKSVNPVFKCPVCNHQFNKEVPSA